MKLGKVAIEHVWFTHQAEVQKKKLYVNAYTYFNYYSFEAQRPDKETRAIS